jgi:hypothetical protein
MSEINKHVYKALETYCNLTVEPEYAVLVKGSWGCGKTHFINDVIDQQKQNSLKFLFVSLYGVSSIDEIETEFFLQLNPKLANKKLVLAGKVVDTVLQSFKFDSKNTGVQEYFTNTEDHILVFDDLERCQLELNKVLGYINNFVEKNKYKVIIIADETKLEKMLTGNEQTYSEIKEKLIGKTLQLESDVDSVFDMFANNILSNTDLKAAFEDNKQEIIDIYKQSGYNNLRSLRKIFLEFSSLYTLIDTEISKNPALMRHLLQLFTLISMEIYAGAIKVSDLSKHLGSDYFLELAAEKVDGEIERNKRISGKYTININETLLEVADWQQWFSKGILDSKKINGTLIHSSYLQQQNTPDWKKLLHLFDLDQAEFEKLQQSVWLSFKNFEINIVGEILHVVGLFLYLSNKGLIKQSDVDILKIAESIVTELSERSLFNTSDSYDIDDSYDGFVFYSHESQQFKDFILFLLEQSELYQSKVLECKAPQVIDAMKNDLKKFKELMCGTKDRSNSFAYKSILNQLEDGVFLDALESLPNTNKKEVFRVLGARYKGQLSTSMNQEREWMIKVQKEITSKFKTVNTIDSLVMMKFVEWTKEYVKLTIN